MASFNNYLLVVPHFLVMFKKLIIIKKEEEIDAFLKQNKKCFSSFIRGNCIA